MAHIARPTAVAFDIIGTTFSLEALRGPLQEIGLDDSLDLWFTRSLRDAFALAVTGAYVPFRRVLGGNLEALAAEKGRALDANGRDRVLDRFASLPPQPDAQEAFASLADAGVRILALSNGARASSESLLEKAGLRRFVSDILSVDDRKMFKPRAEIYAHAVEASGADKSRVALIAAHAWDVHGAKRAGLMAGYVMRGRQYPAHFDAPDVNGDGLADVAHAFARARA